MWLILFFFSLSWSFSYLLRFFNTVRNDIGRRLLFMDFMYNSFKLY